MLIIFRKILRKLHESFKKTRKSVTNFLKSLKKFLWNSELFFLR